MLVLSFCLEIEVIVVKLVLIECEKKCVCLVVKFVVKCEVLKVIVED